MIKVKRSEAQTRGGVIVVAQLQHGDPASPVILHVIAVGA